MTKAPSNTMECHPSVDASLNAHCISVLATRRSETILEHPFEHARTWLCSPGTVQKSESARSFVALPFPEGAKHASTTRKFSDRTSISSSIARLTSPAATGEERPDYKILWMSHVLESLA